MKSNGVLCTPIVVLFSLYIGLLVVSATGVHAQTAGSVAGAVRDYNIQPVAGASVRLATTRDTLQTSTDNEGRFTFASVRARQFTLIITSLGYDTTRREVAFEEGVETVSVPPIILMESSQLIDAVTVQGAGAITFKEDTLEYSTRDLKLREGAQVEDALRQLDGVEVDKDGNVTAQGESVTRARINGRDYFGGDIKTAIQNLPADIIEKIQIVDDYGDMANLTGNRTGDPERVLNLQVDPRRNRGSFGNFRAGGGTEDRYLVDGSLNMMWDKTELALTANGNNTNFQRFNFNIGGGGARRGPGGGSYGAGRGGFGGSNGITDAQSIGFDLKHAFNDKLETYGDYRYGHNDNNTLSDQLREEALATGILLSSSNINNGSVSNTHRFSWNVEYKPTDKTFIKVSPTFHIGNTVSDNLSLSAVQRDNELVNNVSNNQANRNFNPSYGISALFNRRLSDNGRNVFVNFSLNTATSQQDRENILNTVNLELPIEDREEAYQRHLVDLQNKNLNGGASLSYIEPLGEYSNLEVSYDFNFASYDNSQFNNGFDSNGDMIGGSDFNFDRAFDYTFSTHRAGLTYRYRKDNFNYSFGLSAQPNILSGTSLVDGVSRPINRSGFNFVPIARLEYRPSRNKSFNINYTGRANEPSFSQIQPFTDYSNAATTTGIITATTGNPDLNAQFAHEIRINFRNFNMESGSSISASVTGTLSEDRIVNNRITSQDPELGIVQETRYVNDDGYYQGRAFFNYNKPVFNKKLTLSYFGMGTYTNNVSFTNSERNIGKNWMLANRFGLRFNPKETVEVMPSVGYTYNTTTNTLASQSRLNRDISTWSLSLFSTVNLSPTWIYGVDLTKTNNNGYDSSVDANPMIINTYIEKQFLKGRNGAIRFQAFDLLNEQTNVSRVVTDGYTLDNRSNRLARYFMLTLSYRFQNFGGGMSPQRDNPWSGPGGRPGGPGGRP